MFQSKRLPSTWKTGDGDVSEEDEIPPSARRIHKYVDSSDIESFHISS